MDGKAIEKNGDIPTIKQKRYSRKTAGGCITPPLRRLGLTLLVAGSWLPLLVAGGLFRTPLISPVLTGRFLKFKRHSFRLNMIYISKKKFQKFVEGGI